jgi:prolyl oligopeptidase
MKAAVVAAGILLLNIAGAANAQATDPYLWLEQANDPQALGWVKKENDKTAAVLEKDPRYPGLYQEALNLAQAKDRIPLPRMHTGAIYNLWQDGEHVRGIWRRTSWKQYRQRFPAWTTVLDLDTLSSDEGANWFLTQVDCSEPEQYRCVLSLSDGGEDAVTLREFDLRSMKFVPDGFVLPHGKQTAAWQDQNTMLIAREWSPGELTQSGYPFVVKRLTRGQPLSSAQEVFRGSKDDGGYGVAPLVLRDGAGHRAIIIQRPLTTFEFEFYLVVADKPILLPLPKKSQILGLVQGKLIVSLAQDWVTSGNSYSQGSLVALDLTATAHDPAHLKAEAIYEPGPRESFDSAAATRNALLITAFDNVRGRAFVYRPAAHGGWERRRLELPDNATVGIVDADLHSERAFVSVQSYLQPTGLWSLDTANGVAEQIKSLPPKFDASRDIVEQFEAKSSDGVDIPYFIVRPRDLKMDGNAPTILYAYGGFQISLTPVYSPAVGKLWLEKGGVYVMANIRGGGEFGPAWHDAGLKTRRQLIYDDFAAVARDLIARRITSARRLGIQGGSNGGLLMGVQFTQHPELWNAVDIQVPLLDMLRYEQIAAGTSWVGEYGSVSVPDEAAFLAQISPYNNIHRGISYPEPLIWTTTKDDRVGPQHARKFAARLSEYGIPYLFYEVIEGGHASGANLQEKAHTTAMEMTYFAQKLFD